MFTAERITPDGRLLARRRNWHHQSHVCVSALRDSLTRVEAESLQEWARDAEELHQEPRLRDRRGSGVSPGETALIDLLQYKIGHRLQFEAELVHPLRHQTIDRDRRHHACRSLLPVLRQASDAFGHCDLCEKCFDWKAALIRWRSRSLKHTMTRPQGIRCRHRRMQGRPSRSSREDAARYFRVDRRQPGHEGADRRNIEPVSPTRAIVYHDE